MMKKIKVIVLLFIVGSLLSKARDYQWNYSKNNNPVLPGYFADPTIKKFGDTYYIYSTTDGVKLASGEPTVWVSKDLKNWYNRKLTLQLPVGLTNCWAPDVVKGKDGRFYYYMGNCQFGCNIYGYVSDSPLGPFVPISGGKPVIPVGTSKENLPALDAQFFYDDDGSLYAYFGTWCTSFGGMGWVKIDPNDMCTIIKSGFIPISQIPHAFEAAYPIKMNGKYFLMYSAGDCRLSSYAVHYSVSDSPEGPFVYGKNNPILVTNNDSTIDGPGHHSILQDEQDCYIVYHRHDNPHSTGGEFRQTCIDKINFNGHSIEKITPTHKGVDFSNKVKNKIENLALNAKIQASSSYHLISKGTRYSKKGYDYLYKPENAVDNNNGTLWKAASAKLPQYITIDLGVTKNFNRICTEFEYPTYYYQYKIETSKSGKRWQLYADRTTNRRCGSPLIDDKTVNARYIRLTITGTEKTGMIPAIWNIKVYNEHFEIPISENNESPNLPGAVIDESLIVNLDAQKIKEGIIQNPIKNRGKLGGVFNSNGVPEVKRINGVKSIYFNGESWLQLSENSPASLNWNAPFTVSVWVLNPEIGDGECLLAWNTRENMLQSSYAALMYGTNHYGAMAHGDGAVDLRYKNVPEKGKWNHIVVTFDGALENVYVNGKLDTQTPISLFVERGNILVGASGERTEFFSGYIANVRLYGTSMTQSEVVKLLNKTKPKGITN
ncbi:MAG: family 43 glycosylhydrolase [Porphyromonadaceae bacterium]|nr:family 43 glycosylhydrolase [Porphyromonadaceae bacterium]